MITKTPQPVKLLSSREWAKLRYQVYKIAGNLTEASLYSILGILNTQLYFACENYGVVQPGTKDFNFDRLRQLAFTSLDGCLEVVIPTKYLHEEHLPKYYPQSAKSKNTTLKICNLLGDVYFEELVIEDGKKTRQMVLNDEPNPDTGEFEEKCIRGLGIYNIVRPVSQDVVGKDGSEKKGGITVEPTRYECYNIAKALVVFREVYRILEKKYNEKHKWNPEISFYDQLPSHKCNFVRNLWNAFMLGVDDFEGNIYTDEEIDFTFDYPDNLVEKVKKGFTLVWKETFKIAEEIWNKMEMWGRAIPSWRKVNPYPEVEVREFEFEMVEF